MTLVVSRKIGRPAATFRFITDHVYRSRGVPLLHGRLPSLPSSRQAPMPQAPTLDHPP